MKTLSHRGKSDMASYLWLRKMLSRRGESDMASYLRLGNTVSCQKLNDIAGHRQLKNVFNLQMLITQSYLVNRQILIKIKSHLLNYFAKPASVKQREHVSDVVLYDDTLNICGRPWTAEIISTNINMPRRDPCLIEF